jgi:hypothetical protein
MTSTAMIAASLRFQTLYSPSDLKLSTRQCKASYAFEPVRACQDIPSPSISVAMTMLTKSDIVVLDVARRLGVSPATRYRKGALP